jgi:prepilin-type N-terminal cleavage/methylation domain-containing protein
MNKRFSLLRSARSQRGMTLMEVLIAVAILAMIGVYTNGSLLRTWRSKKLLEKVNDDYHGARAVLDRMARELSMSFITPPVQGGDQSRVPVTLFKGEDSSPVSKITFTSFSHVRVVRNTRESDQNVVSYYGKPNPKNSRVYQLFRREKVIIDGKPDEGGVSYALLDNVVKLEVKYWDKQRGDFTQDWDTQKIEFRGKLPPLIEIRLTVMGPDNRELTFMTRTKLFWYGFITRR